MNKLIPLSLARWQPSPRRSPLPSTRAGTLVTRVAIRMDARPVGY
jgi:hypothetical protein